jgi:hypothetical protein
MCAVLHSTKTQRKSRTIMKRKRTTPLFTARAVAQMHDDWGGDKLPLEHAKTIQIEKVPETNDAEAWTNFNKRLNDLANQGYKINHATDRYILLTKPHVAFRREE